MLTGDPYQDRISMEKFKVREDAFNDRGGYNIQGLDDGPAGGQGIMGGQDIRRYLTPFLQQIQQRNQAEMQEKIDPYVQEVQQLTDQTFPDLNLSGGGLRGGLGSLFGGGMSGPAVDFMTPNMGNPFGGGMNALGGGLIPQVGASQATERAFQSSQNSSPFGTDSFFR